jgi:hypothetical protein
MKPPLVQVRARFVEAEPCRVRGSPDGNKEVRPVDLSILDRQDEPRNCCGHRCRFCTKGEGDAFTFECAFDNSRELWIFSREDTGALLHHRDIGSESAKHLGELAPNVSRTENDQMLRKSRRSSADLESSTGIWSSPGWSGIVVWPPAPRPISGELLDAHGDVKEAEQWHRSADPHAS